MNTSSPRRSPAAWAAQGPEWLALLLLIAAAIPAILVRRQLTVVPNLNLLDGSWVLDIGYKAAIGSWLGRDVLFTYGPLYQWLSSAPSRWIGVSTGTILATSSTLPNLVSILAIFAGARLLLPKASSWRRTLFLIVALWTFPGIRLAICLFAFAAFLRLADAVAARASVIVPAAIASAIIGVASFLISADAGLYVAAAFVLCVASTAAVERKTPGALLRLCAFLIAVVAGVAILMIATNAVLSSPFNFSYWKSSLILVSGYRWFEAKQITAGSTARLLIAFAVGVAIFATAARRRKLDGGDWPLRPAFLFAAFPLALLMMQSALVRSDVIHVANGIYPLVFLSGAILIAARPQRRWLSAALPVIFIATAPLMMTPFIEPLPVALLQGAREIARPNLDCPPGKQQFDRACFSPADAQLFTAVAADIDQHTAPGDPIVVFPYQNAFGVMSRRNVAGGVLQAYLANGEYLTDLDLAGLRRANPPFGVYLPETAQFFGPAAPEGMYSYAMDGVPNFTRSPDIWFYLFRHYRSASAPAPDVVGLVRDDSRDQRVTLAEEKIADGLGTVRITKRHSWLEFGPVHWPAAGSDFIRLRLRVDYPVSWKIRKPSSLALLIHFADNSWQLSYFVVEPGRDSEVWVYPGDARQMGGYFSSDDPHWPRGRPPARLAVLIYPFDWVSAAPETISITAVDAVRISLK